MVGVGVVVAVVVVVSVVISGVVVGFATVVIGPGVVADKVAAPVTESKEGEGIVEAIPEKIDTVEEVTDKVQEGIGFYSNPLLP